MGIFDFLFGKKKETLETAHEINQKHVSNHPTAKDDEDALVREASLAITGREFEKGIDLYQKLADNYPEKRGLYNSQIGVGHYFLGDYNKAIEFYLKAKEDDDNGMIDDNVWEACEAIYDQTNDLEAIQRYLNHYPNGSYAKKANKIIAKHS